MIKTKRLVFIAIILILIGIVSLIVPKNEVKATTYSFNDSYGPGLYKGGGLGLDDALRLSPSNTCSSSAAYKDLIYCTERDKQNVFGSGENDLHEVTKIIHITRNDERQYKLHLEQLQ